MIKKQVYPKAKRVKVKNEKICQLTEKLDGSNLCIFKNDLDDIYDCYRSCKNRDVEGIIVNYNNNISKYVRMKNGQLQEHFDRGE